MLRILVAFSLLVSIYGAAVKDNNGPDGRIVGGHAISINQAPYQAAYELGGRHKCGASVISNNYALSAAHCSISDAASQVDIRVGSAVLQSGGSLHKAAQIINHSRYSTSPVTDFDISLIRVATPFVYSASVRAIALASSLPAAGAQVEVSGWGRTSESGSKSSQLLQVQVDVVSNAECNRAYSNHITSTMLCAGTSQGGKDSCQEDSGGPLVHGTQQVGVVSFGIGCGRAGIPGVYASVPALRSWIREHAGV